MNMNRFTIPCTEEQTKKAFELGAPLDIGVGKRTVLCRYQNYNTYKRCVIPTTEQMIGWLEEQDLQIIMSVSNCNMWGFDIYNIDLSSREMNVYHKNCCSFKTRKEATLAAIDEALEYLSNKK